MEVVMSEQLGKSSSISLAAILAGVLYAGAAYSPVAAQGGPPDFSANNAGWVSIGTEWAAVPETAPPVRILAQHDGDVRRVYMNVPHSANVKPSWYGESVGHYEGGTLVIDTIGLNDKTFVDNFRTPHSEKLHVVERYRLIEDGKRLE